MVKLAARFFIFVGFTVVFFVIAVPFHQISQSATILIRIPLYFGYLVAGLGLARLFAKCMATVR